MKKNWVKIVIKVIRFIASIVFGESAKRKKKRKRKEEDDPLDE